MNTRAFLTVSASMLLATLVVGVGVAAEGLLPQLEGEAVLDPQGWHAALTWPRQSLVFSPDGKLLASTNGARGTVHLWDVARAKEVAVLRKAGRMFVAFSPDGKSLAASGESGEKDVLLWDVAGRKKIGALRGDNVVYEAVFSPDGKKLAAVERDFLRVWDVEKRKELGENRLAYRLFPDRSLSARLLHVDSYHSAKQPLLLALPHNPYEFVSFTLIDPFTSATALACGLPGDLVCHVAMDREEKMLASAGNDRVVRLWDRVRGENKAAFGRLPGDPTALTFSPDGKLLACAFGGMVNRGGGFAGFRLYSVPDGKVRAEQKDIIAVRLAFSPDGHLLASGDSSGLIKLWRLPRR